MALFEMPKLDLGRSNKQQDVDIARKTRKKQPSVTSVKGGGSLMAKINAIKAVVEQNLGKYKETSLLIQEESQLSQYIDKCLENGVISIDTETDGLNTMLNHIAGVCIYTPGQFPAYVPINHISYITNLPLPNQILVEVVREQLQRCVDADIDVIMFHAEFDVRVLRHQVGVYMKCTWDGYLAARCLNENEPSNKLKLLHQKYVLNGQEDAFTFESLFNGVVFTLVPPNVGYLYACHDALITYELYQYQKQFLDPNSSKCQEYELQNVAWVFNNIEMPCVSVVCDMEDNGVCFDINYAMELSKKYHELEQKQLATFYSLLEDYSKSINEYKRAHPNNKLSDPISISSPTQLAILFYDILGVEPPDPKKPRGTGEDILQKIDSPLCKAILDYRATGKLLSTYIDKLPNDVNPIDRKIHCSFNQYGADTGRFSSSDPNLQNIPSHNKDIRKMFVASPGCVLMSSDYSQQEPKVMTQMCGDEKMLDAYRHNKDLYAQIASIAFNKPYEDCLEFVLDENGNKTDVTNKEGKERRSSAKSILLGILYGRGIKSVAEQLHTTKEKAQLIQDKIFKGFPAIPKFEKDSKRMALELGYVTTLWGRKRRLPDLSLEEFEFSWKDGVPPTNDLLDFDSVPEVNTEVPESCKKYYLKKLRGCWGTQKRVIFEEAKAAGIIITDNGAKIADADRQVVNARIQGSAADMSKLALILVGNDKRLQELGFKLLIPVHDELIAECPKENAKEAAERFAKLMSEAAKSKLTVPISCDVEITERWYGEKVEV